MLKRLSLLAALLGPLLALPLHAEANLTTIRRIVADPAHAPFLYVYFDDVDDSYHQVALTADKVQLFTKTVAGKAEVPIARLQPFKSSGVDLDLAILLQTNFDYYMPNPTTLSSGAQQGLQGAIAAFGTSIGDKAHGVLFAYGEPIGGQPTKLGDFQPIAGLAAAASTVASDPTYISANLHDGLMAALGALKAKPEGDRKVIIVFGDGSDVNDANMSDVISAANGAQVAICALGYTIGEPGATTARLTKLANNTGGFAKIVPDKGDPTGPATDLGNVIALQDVATAVTPYALWDGADQAFAVRTDAQSDGVSVTLAKVAPIAWPQIAWHPPALWPWIAGGAAGLLLLLMLLVAKARANAPAEAAVEAAPAKWKTQAIDLGAVASGGVPMVGWLVALSGSTKGATYRCQPRTMVGSGPDCHINPSDPFMSLNHCEIICEGGAFKLIDSGSTNGVFINEKKVKAQELVDNDTLRIGKTDFKFKSIN